MKKLAILFPGIGYTCEKPLLYYSGKCAREAGYELMPVPYGNFPSGVLGDREKMRYCFDHALRQTRDFLKDVEWASYDRIVFIAKSVGTVVACAFAREMGLQVRSILLTPLAETFSFLPDAREGFLGLDAVPEKIIAFHGTKDPWADTEVVKQFCQEKGIPLFLTKDGNHSLETGDVLGDLKTLEDTMKQVRDFIG